jgi:TetR/AcrR family transcriptional repressor of mexJK operon
MNAVADQLAQLCKASIHEKLFFGMAEAITAQLAHRSVHGAVDMLLARYGAPV